MAKLSGKRAAFVREYLVDLNATQAAIRAGYSVGTAKQQGSRLLTDADVQAAVAAGQQKRAARVEITADRVVQEYAKIAFASILDIVRRFDNRGVELKSSEDITPEAIAAIACVQEEFNKAGDKVVTYKMHSKTEALNALAKHLGVFPDKRLEDKVRAELESMLDSLRTKLKRETFDEVISAIEAFMGVGALAPDPASRGEGSALH